jgi:hypothetical protein
MPCPYGNKKTVATLNEIANDQRRICVKSGAIAMAVPARQQVAQQALQAEPEVPTLW